MEGHRYILLETTTRWCHIPVLQTGVVLHTGVTYWCYILMPHTGGPHTGGPHTGSTNLCNTYARATLCKKHCSHRIAEVKGGVDRGQGIVCRLQANRPELRRSRAVEGRGEGASDSHLRRLPFSQHAHIRDEGPGQALDRGGQGWWYRKNDLAQQKKQKRQKKTREKMNMSKRGFRGGRRKEVRERGSINSEVGERGREGERRPPTAPPTKPPTAKTISSTSTATTISSTPTTVPPKTKRTSLPPTSPYMSQN